MFFGADQHWNSLSNMLTIKCYKCGDTNLRYIGGNNNPSGDLEKPYICGNGHYTWGAVDDWSTPGQTDGQLNPVNDCCCEGTSCDFPETIKVTFSGILGVQAREGSFYRDAYSSPKGDSEDQFWLDFKSRVSMPYSMCCECSTFNRRNSDDNPPDSGNNNTGVPPPAYAPFDPSYFLDEQLFGGSIRDDFISASCGGISVGSGGITIDGHPDKNPRTMWPYRIATFEAIGYEQDYQLIIDHDTGLWTGSDHIYPNRCGCMDSAFGQLYDYKASPPCENPSGVPVDLCQQVEYTAPNGEIMAVVPPIIDLNCMTPKFYPSCLASGTSYCVDSNSRYRVPCANPNNKYVIDLGNQSGTFNINATAWTAPVGIGRCCDFGYLLIDEDDVPGCEQFNLPGSGMLSFPMRYNNPESLVDQPNCVRRVNSPSFSSRHNYYAVNTEDLSNQEIILDRYYSTGGSFDWEWKNRLKDVSGVAGNNVLNYGDRGYTSFTNGAMYPHPFQAHSGSATEPEIVAIIHSEKGRGGQIAFDTFPVSYDSDVLLEPEYFQTKVGTCNWKHRLTVNGYGVKYPLIDDPQWWNDIKGYMTYPVFVPGVDYEIGDKIEFRCWKTLEDASSRGVTPELDEPFDLQECVETIIATATITELDDERLAPSKTDVFVDKGGAYDIVSSYFTFNYRLKDTLAFPNKRYYEYYEIIGVDFDYNSFASDILENNIVLPSGSYAVNDLFNAQFHPHPNSIAPCANGVCVDDQPVIKIDTIGIDAIGNELPTSFSIVNRGAFYQTIRTGGIRWYDFDEHDQNGDPLYFIGDCPCTWDVCQEMTYEDAVLEIGSSEQATPERIYGIAQSKCYHGCMSKLFYPSGHHKMDALPAHRNSLNNALIPGGFPAFPGDLCVGGAFVPSGNSSGVTDQGLFGENLEQWTTNFCNGAGRHQCQGNCTHTTHLKVITINYGGEVGIASVIDVDDEPIPSYTGNRCDPITNCSCDYPYDIPTDLPGRYDYYSGLCSTFDDGDTFTGICSCSTGWGNWTDRPYVGPWTIDENNVSESGKCYPLNRTWEWHSGFYALSSCSGDPIISGTRAYITEEVGIPMVIPHRRPQFKCEWLPRPLTTLSAIESSLRNFYPDAQASQIDDLVIKNTKEEFLLRSGEGCNPLNIGLQFNSYKFPNLYVYEGSLTDECCGKYQYTNSLGDCYVEDQEALELAEETCDSLAQDTNLAYFDIEHPCRKWNEKNPITPYNSGLLDDYCRVYGFYQQIQPDCKIIYKGQYILRAMQNDNYNKTFVHEYALKDTDCYPLIESITVHIDKKRSQFDVNLGAPYDQDYLIPENLPSPIKMSLDSTVSTADPWNYPSKDIWNSPVFYNHGFYEPNRRLYSFEKYIPGESLDPPYDDPYTVDEIIPTETMWPVDGNDWSHIYIGSGNDRKPIRHDMYNSGVWDMPDPRSNIRVQPYSGVYASGGATERESGVMDLDINGFCELPLYTGIAFTGALSAWPSEVLRNTFIHEFPYPWENNCQPDITGSPYPCEDYYAMVKNNSAIVALSEIEECEYCTLNTVLLSDPTSYLFQNGNPSLPSWFHYTLRIFVDEEFYSSGSQPSGEVAPTPPLMRGREFLIRAYGDSYGEENSVLPTAAQISGVIDDYVDIIQERYNLEAYRAGQTPAPSGSGASPSGSSGEPSFGELFWASMQNDDDISLMTNMMFGGDINGTLDHLNKIEIYQMSTIYPSGSGATREQPLYFESFDLAATKSRCENPEMKTGSIKKLDVINGGSNYAFEIEERVNPTGIPAFIPNAELTPSFFIHQDSRRRREKYGLSGVSVNHTGDPGYHYSGDWYSLDFDYWTDDDYARSGLYYEIGGIPIVQISEVEVVGQDGSGVDLTKVKSVRVLESGVFWKYVKTGEHRAFPISTVLNNYWEKTHESMKNTVGIEQPSYHGRNALFTPLVEVNPLSPNYGKILSMDIQFGGQEYVVPSSYWTIDTIAGYYNDFGELETGLDIQHLVDPEKYKAQGHGLSPSGVHRYRVWLNETEPLVYHGKPYTLHPDKYSGVHTYNSSEQWWRENYNEEVQLPPPHLSDWADVGNFTPWFNKPVSYWYHTPSDHSNGLALRWQDRIKSFSTIMDSSACPLGKSGLLDRTYEMALVEEVSLAGQSISDGLWGYRPYIATCGDNLCDFLAEDLGPCNLFKLDAPPAASGDPPNREYYSMFLDEDGGSSTWGVFYGNCHWLECNNYTAYDAHRYPIVYVDNRELGYNAIGAPNTRPLNAGCPQRVNPYEGYCLNPYNTSYRDISADLAQDQCANAKYSLMVDLTAHRHPAGGELRYIRSRMLSYEMASGVPITMKIEMPTDYHQSLADKCEDTQNSVLSDICPECDE